jgi:pimeloyl-ACP methyl ester carboxylesterase
LTESNDATERQFTVAGFTLAAREWGVSGGAPVIALHGWLDNAGSFDLLAPRLEGCHVIALDAAGHGFSGNRSADSGYNIWQDVADILDVAATLGWDRFHLLGHSRGAAAAALFAGTFPERVRSLALIEGGVPVLARADEAPVLLAKAIIDVRELGMRSGRVFADRRTAINERANGFSKVSFAAAEVLARRSLRAVPGGYQWHADQRLKTMSELRLTGEQVRGFFGRVSAPALLFLAAESPFTHKPWFLETLGALTDLSVRHLPGGHHLHMEGGEEAIARELQAFLSGR